MRKNKGITLIALIITIVTLIILAALVVDIAVDGHLIDKAKDAVAKTEPENIPDNLIKEWDDLLDPNPGEEDNETNPDPNPGGGDNEINPDPNPGGGGNEINPDPGCTTHTPGDWIITKEATCTATGTRVKKCTVCNTIIETETIQAVAHSYGAWVTTKAATCTATGTKTRTCSNCSNVETQTIAATGHTAGNWTITKEATCTATGTQVKKCTVCNVTVQTSTISALGHNYVNGTCSRCGEVHLISFTVSGDRYQAKEGMTWSQWCSSSYNSGTYRFYVASGGFYIQQISSYGYVCYAGEAVAPSDKIRDGYSYTMGV